MPAAALAFCLSPACKRRVKSGRCREHSPKAFAGHNGNRHARGLGTAWDALRLRVIHEEHRCQWRDDDGTPCGLLVRCPKRGCGQQGVQPQVDHVKPRAEGGSNDRANLRVLCAPHHARKTRRDAARARGGGSKSLDRSGGRTESAAPHARAQVLQTGGAVRG